MPHRCVSLAVLLLGTLAVVLASIAQQGPTEAPTGFDTATLAQSAGSQSVSNGIAQPAGDRKSTRLNSSHGYISYAVFCLKKKKGEHYRTVGDSLFQLTLLYIEL